MKVTVTTTVDVAYCYQCPHLQSTMDGPSCYHPKRTDGAYSNIVGVVLKGFPEGCPEVKKLNPKKELACDYNGNPCDKKYYKDAMCLHEDHDWARNKCYAKRIL